MKIKRNHYVISRMNKRILTLFLSVVMLFSVSGSVHAENVKKPSETVYVLLDENGAAREIIVKKDGIEETGVTGELPFNIKISYLLDGTQVLPKDILGMGGDVKITIDITSNSKAKPYYKENLALQMQLPIDLAGVATDITAEGLSGVTVGTIRTLSGIVLQGESADYEISYQTQAFELQSINFVCMPFDMTGMIDFDVTSIGTQITELQDGVGQYVDGMDKASKGFSQANVEISKIAENGTMLIGGYTQATAGADALMQAMLATMPPEQQMAFAPQMQAVQAGQKQITDSLNAYTDGVAKASAGLSQVTAGTAELAQNGSTLKKGIHSAIEPLLNMTNRMETVAEPEAFATSDQVSDIQFVMKTDALTVIQIKADVLPTEKPKESFWDRLTALFSFELK